MTHFILTALWNSAFAQFGIAGIILIISVALFFYTPLPGIRHICVGLATGACVFLFVSVKFYHEGYDEAVREWKMAEAASEENAKQARADAEQEVKAAEGGGRAGGIGVILRSKRMRNDRFDRDKP